MDQTKLVRTGNLLLGIVNIASPLLFYAYVHYTYGASILSATLTQTPNFTLLKTLAFNVFIGFFNIIMALLFYLLPKRLLPKYLTAGVITILTSLFFLCATSLYLNYIFTIFIPQLSID